MNAACLFDEDADYMILSALDPNVAMDVSQGEHNRNKLIIWQKHGGFNQRFKIKFYSGKYGIYCHDLNIQVESDHKPLQV